MKPYKIILLFFAITTLLQSCKSVSNDVEKNTIPKTSVQVVSIGNASIDDELILFGTTIYLKRNLVTSSITAFITKVNIKIGDKVNKGDVLYTLQTKESSALGNTLSKTDTALTNFGILKVKATATGVITSLDKQQIGDYVLEGTQLCTIAESGDLMFQINVPYEYTSYTKIGNACTLILPDNTMHSATFTKALTSMNVASQTQTILAQTTENLMLPENMIIKANIIKGARDKKQVLPKSCVLSDEMMQQFWVMKLINDSTAIKVNVKIGNRNDENIEILAPKFTTIDRLVSTGNYGLADTALVNIMNNK